MSFPVVNGVEVAVPPPTGYRVDFDNPETDESMVRNAYWIFGLEFAFATAFLGQRLYTNGVILRKFMIDDCKYTMFVSFGNECLHVPQI
jgi:hypothetical protein